MVSLKPVLAPCHVLHIHHHFRAHFGRSAAIKVERQSKVSVPNLSTQPADRWPLIISAIPICFSAKKKKKKVSLSFPSVAQLVCSCLHLNRKEDLTWAVMAELQYKQLFLLHLSYLQSQIKQIGVTLKVRYCISCDRQPEATVKKTSSTKEQLRRKIWKKRIEAQQKQPAALIVRSVLYASHGCYTALLVRSARAQDCVIIAS